MIFNMENLRNCFDSRGGLSDNLLYVELFGKKNVPSVFIKQVLVTDNKVFDMQKMTYSYLSELFPDMDVMLIETEGATLCSSASSERFNVDYSETYGPDGYVTARRRLIDYVNNAIVLLSDTSIQVTYDPTLLSDVKAYASLIYNALPVTTSDDNFGNPSVGLVTFNNNGYSLSESEINRVTLDINKSYNDDFKPVYENIVKFLDKNNRKSGIVLLNGEPGTGKTYLIRHLINTVKNNYIVITPSMAQHIGSPSFVEFLIDNRDSVFILEDCEDVIASRNSRFMSGISSILQMSDGLMSDIFNGKFICTFNCDITSVDDAVLRKGRCIAQYEFCKLDKKKVEVLMKELGHDLPEYEDMTHAEIYNYTGVDNTPKRKKAGF